MKIIIIVMFLHTNPGTPADSELGDKSLKVGQDDIVTTLSLFITGNTM